MFLLYYRANQFNWFLLYEMDIGRYKVNRYTVHFKNVAKKVSFKIFLQS